MKFAVLFLPSLIGLLAGDWPRGSVAWSFAGSVFIAIVAQTRWFTGSREAVGFAARLLRPSSIFHFFFIVYHVAGGAFHALDADGWSFSGRVSTASEAELIEIAAAQQLMLLGHAAITAGMRLAGPTSCQPAYIVRTLPRYLLIGVSLGSVIAAPVVAAVPGLENLARKLLDLALACILVDIARTIRRGDFAHLPVPVALLAFNFVEQLLSGWKGGVLFVVVTLGGMLYPFMRKTVLAGGAVFVALWALYIHPFGLALRPMIWYQGMDRETAAAISWDHAANMSIDDRLRNVWTMMSSRSNDLRPFRLYMQYVPGRHPFYGSELVIDAAIAAVPRVIWPGKPDMESIAMRRVYDAGVVRRDAVVSAKPNFYQDAYMSGGWQGVLIACLLCGLVIGLVNRACERWFGGYDIGTCLVYTALFAPAFNLPSSFEFFVGSTTSSVFVLPALFCAGRLSGVLVAAPSPSTERHIVRHCAPANAGASGFRPVTHPGARAVRSRF